MPPGIRAGSLEHRDIWPSGRIALARKPIDDFRKCRLDLRAVIPANVPGKDRGGSLSYGTGSHFQAEVLKTLMRRNSDGTTAAARMRFSD